MKDYKKKKGVRYVRGYKLIKFINHPYNSQGYVPEHRLVAEQYLLNDNNCIVINGQKYLSPKFTVHHIDFNRLNNNPQNLMIIESNKHLTMHKNLYNKQYFLDYCKRFNLDTETVRKTRTDFKVGCYKQYI